MAFCVGAAKVEITPAPGTFMAGYAARESVSQGIADPLFVRALVMTDGCAEAVLAVLDVEGIDDAFRDNVRQELRCLGFDPSLVMVTATHTHSGPRGLLSCDQYFDSAYAELVRTRTVEAIEAARSAKMPVCAYVTRTQVREVATNRFDIGASCDTELISLHFVGITGSRAAIIVNYACHPTVLGENNLLISADFPGYMLRVLEERYPSSVPIFWNGAAGDISTRFVRKASTFEEAERIGRKVADAVTNSELDLVPVNTSPIRGCKRVVRLPKRVIPTEAEARKQLEDAKRRLRELERSGAPPPEVRKAFTAVQGAEGTLSLAVHGESSLPCAGEIQVVRLGDVALVGVPFELFSPFGIAIKRQSSFDTTMVIGYCNGYLGYVVTPEACAARTYEAGVTRFAPSAGDVLVNSVLELLADVSQLG